MNIRTKHETNHSLSKVNSTIQVKKKKKKQTTSHYDNSDIKRSAKSFQIQ